MRCPEVRDLLQPFLDGELEVDRNVSMLKHLEMCPPCKTQADDARALHQIVSRSACEAVCSEGRQRLLAQAYMRCADDDPVCHRARWRARLVMAAVVLVTLGGLGVAGAKHARCLTNCQTKRVIARAHQLGLMEHPLGAEELARRFGAGYAPPPSKYLSVNAVVGWPEDDDACAKRGPILRYRCNCDGTTIVVFSIEDAHVHSWQVERLDDGQDWVVLEDGGVQVLGWFDAENSRLWCFLGEKSIPHMDERLRIVASDMRRPR